MPRKKLKSTGNKVEEDILNEGGTEISKDFVLDVIDSFRTTLYGLGQTVMLQWGEKYQARGESDSATIQFREELIDSYLNN